MEFELFDVGGDSEHSDGGFVETSDVYIYIYRMHGELLFEMFMFDPDGGC